MSSKDKVPPAVRARLRIGENPYAFAEFEDEDRASEAPVRAEYFASARAGSAIAAQGDLFGSGEHDTPAAHTRNPAAARERSGNPYASLENVDEDLAATPSRGELLSDSPNVRAASKTEFRRGATRIFLQYVPSRDGRGLRQYMRDFIARNESRSGRARYRLLEALRRFDLSDIPGAVPQFNREDEPLSEQKLREIERSIGSER